MQIKKQLPCFLRLLVIGLASTSFPHAQAQSVDAFLENSTLKIGVNAGSYGGAIVWLSGSNGANLVNTYDKGREIQQSFYAGSSITAPNQSPSWSPWTWNPIMVGDYAGNVSPVLALKKSAGRIYVKTQPLLWDRNKQLSQSYMEQWISLHPTLPNVVAVDCRFTSFRDANDAWGAPALRDQELPAAYFVSALNTIKAYTGKLPWTHGKLATIPNSPATGTFPWSSYRPTEPWTACVNANGFGVGVYTPIATTFLAGKSGSGVSTNPFDVSTMYVAPLGQYAFPANTVFSYRFYLILGHLTGIRKAVYTLHSAAEVPPPSPTGPATVAYDWFEYSGKDRQETPMSGNFTWRDEFKKETLSLPWVMLRAPKETWWKLNPIGKGHLAITPRAEQLTGKSNPSFLGHRVQHSEFSASTLMTVPKEAGVAAGLAVFQNDRFHYFLAVQGGEKDATICLERIKDGTKEIVASAPLAKSATLFLRIRANGPVCSFDYALEPGAWKTLSADQDAKLFTTAAAGVFVGATVGPYARLGN